MSGYYTYETLAARERDPFRRVRLRQLAKAEHHHAQLWEQRIVDLGSKSPVYKGSQNGEADSLANRLGGINVALRRLEVEESRDIARYAKQLQELKDERSTAILREVIKDEREHYKTLRELANRKDQQLSPVEAKELLDEILVKRNQTHSSAAGWMGDSIYGVNDGLGAIFGIVSGVSGATLGNSKVVLLD